MSVSYSPVQWNRNKYFYDAVVVLLVGTYLWLFLELAPAFADYTRAPDTAIIRMRAFGTCAFLMLSAILCIGPLAVLDKRAMPLLYNRRHFGVLTFFVALAHARFVIDWYFAFSPTPKLQALFGSNTAFDQLVGFPFEWFGIFALLVLAIMAATSHDFWLSFLGPKLWKSLHVLVYPAYVSVVAHVVLGALMDDRNPLFAVVVSGCALTVAGLHVAAARVERRRLVAQQGATVDVAGPTPAWLPLGDVRELVDGPRSHRAARRRRACRRVPRRYQGRGPVQRLRTPERAARRRSSDRWLCHLPVARLPVPTGRRLLAGAVHRARADLRTAPRRCRAAAQPGAPRAGRRTGAARDTRRACCRRRHGE